MTPLTEHEQAAIRENLFPEARHVVAALPSGAWHRDRSGQVTATREHSSQALALGVFGTLETLGSKDAIVQAWADALSLPPFGRTQFVPEVVLSPELLGERRSTQVDALVQGDASSALVECKFTEADGGSCSQPFERELPDGSKAAQCNGSYELQKNPITGTTQRCALSAKGIRYWELIPQVLRVPDDLDHSPCPFVGGWFQWMRNLVAARALAQQSGRPHSFVIACAEGEFPMSRKIQTAEWQRFTELLTGAVELRAVSFQRLLSVGREATGAADGEVIDRLRAWVDQKVLRAAQ